MVRNEYSYSYRYSFPYFASSVLLLLLTPYAPRQFHHSVNSERSVNPGMMENGLRNYPRSELCLCGKHMMQASIKGRKGNNQSIEIGLMS